MLVLIVLCGIVASLESCPDVATVVYKQEWRLPQGSWNVVISMGLPWYRPYFNYVHWDSTDSQALYLECWYSSADWSGSFVIYRVDDGNTSARFINITAPISCQDVYAPAWSKFDLGGLQDPSYSCTPLPDGKARDCAWEALSRGDTIAHPRCLLGDRFQP